MPIPFRPAAAALSLAAALAALPAHAAGDAGEAYVSNQEGDVAVIDLATLEV